jgi:hypothetical protein
MLFMVSYDLMKPGQDYAKLDDKIIKLGGKRVLESQWVIENLVTPPITATDLWRGLLPYVDGNDRIFVTELTKDMQWSAQHLLIPDEEMRRLLSRARG